MPNVIVEVDVRVVLPVQWAETAQQAAGHTVSKGLAKLVGRTIALAELSHEFPLVYALGKLEQAQACDVHRCFRGLEIQEPRIQEIDSVHA
jgi:hypothetical protein